MPVTRQTLPSPSFLNWDNRMDQDIQQAIHALRDAIPSVSLLQDATRSLLKQASARTAALRLREELTCHRERERAGGNLAGAWPAQVLLSQLDALLMQPLHYLHRMEKSHFGQTGPAS